MNRKTLRRWLSFFLCLFFIGLQPYHVYAQAKQSKIVGLVAVRNERIFIQQCLRALSLYADAIVVLDDASTDDTVALVKGIAAECKVETIIEKKEWFRDEPGDRNQLLNAGRALGGTHFIMIDADEMFTANCLDQSFLRNQIYALAPGDKLRLNWIQLWRSFKQYRYDGSVWTNNYKDFVFCDDGRAFYSSEFIHTERTPNNLYGSIHRIDGYTYGLLHFQFVNWRNLLIKQAWYRCLERIRLPNRPVYEINNRYAPSKNETGLNCAPSLDCWFEYPFFDPAIFDAPEIWREKQVCEWFAKFGKDYFADLDIWDVDWGKY